MTRKRFILVNIGCKKKVGTFEQWTSRLKFKINLKYVCNPSIIRIPFIIDPFVIHIPFEFKLSLKLMH